ncbi:MAG: hypothetical protein J6M16_03590 [Clostridia bacterium]|nr:hypothetical protein [Clostridia bacterium]
MGKNDNYHFPMGTAYLKLGISGVAEKALKKSRETDSDRSKSLLLGIYEVYNEIALYLKRYSTAIKNCGVKSNKLNRISENLEHLSTKAPEHFDEAVQLVYIMWKLRVLSSCGADIGRLDNQLKDYYEKDISTGYLSENEAYSLITDLWLMINEHNSGDTLINVMLGGINPDGSDSSSDLSVLMLDVTKKLKMTEPHVSVRVHKNMNPKLYKKMLETAAQGQGQAAMFNDEVIIPSLVNFGVAKEHACCYTNDGCCEVMLDGISSIEFLHIDAVATFELAFNNGDFAGCDYRRPSKYFHKNNSADLKYPDVVPGFESGKIEECENFEEFYKCFLKQYRMQVRNKAANLRRMYHDRLINGEASLLVNGSFESVLESGKDYIAGGLLFDNYMLFSGSIPTAADCLVAIKKIVFDEKKYTAKEIKKAILKNYEGYEEMRKALKNAPKFGNDIDEVDLLAADIAEHFCEWLNEYRNETGFPIMPALYGWRFLDEAHAIAATPDGRKYADPIAEHYCATPGAAVSGPTAQIISAAKAKSAIDSASGITVFHITLPASFSSFDEKMMVLDTLIEGARESGLPHMCVGIYDASVLKDAQKCPEKHRDVIVRVWGYSARFTDLCKEMQDHVISRISGL